MRYRAFFFFFLLSVVFMPLEAQDLGQQYIYKWQEFYPGKAVAQGMHQAVFQYEDFSSQKIGEWLDYNKDVREQLLDPKHSYVVLHSIDARLLNVQVISEIHLWEEELPQNNDASLYLDAIKEIVSRAERYDFLTPEDKRILTCTSISAITGLCHAAVDGLELAGNLPKHAFLYELLAYYNNGCPGLVAEAECSQLKNSCDQAAFSISNLIDHLEKLEAINVEDNVPVLGIEEYTRMLAWYTDSDLTPVMLRDLSRKEIELTKKEMAKVATNYLLTTYSGVELPCDHTKIINLALQDMEKDVVSNAAEYLEFWQELTEAAEQFVSDNRIASLPEDPSLRIMTAPESAGPAARIGWVDSAPPFAPNPVTTLYLPSIPDTLPEAEQRDFWASFNKPFNRMIAIHELIPGHYMQLKISRETAHPLRLLFPYGPYIEGWATFTEKILLDAGWEKERPLTYLAHLRKRLENANRAYTSVMVHCYGWTKDEVMDFSIDISLLAPQFAKSLWGRLMRSPMQMTSYFYGGWQFKELYTRQKALMGEDFDLQNFMDTVMKAGPIPIEEFDNIFKYNKKQNTDQDGQD